MARIWSRLSSRARMTRRKPMASRKATRSGVWLCIWVLAMRGRGGRSAFEQAHVLDDGGVDADVVEPVQQANGLRPARGRRAGC